MSEYRKKLIEVALPLDIINRESIHENYIYKGNPSSIHKWWAQRPLVACRAIIFAQMVDDPSSLPEEFPTEEMQEAERKRLFDIIEELAKWENTTNEAVLHKARVEIARSAARNHGISLPRHMTHTEVVDALKRYAPPVLDPFAGGGSIPLEAQRLGVEAYASDLNPVAVLINKALIELPQKYAGYPPVNPNSRKKYLQTEWGGTLGLSEDIRFYGMWMREEAKRRIGHLYPTIQLSKEFGGGEATVLAWIWARTVECPNPICGADMPLVHTFSLSTKKGKEVWVVPEIDRSVTPPQISYHVENTGEKTTNGTVGRRGAICIACNHPVDLGYIRSQAQAGRMGMRLLAIAVEARGKRIYVSPSTHDEQIASISAPSGFLETSLPKQALGFSVQHYGMTKHRDLFMARQLVALSTFVDLLAEVRQLVYADAVAEGLPETSNNAQTLDAHSYADAIVCYLALAIDKVAEYNCTLVPWYTKEDRPKGVFALQTLPILWDFAEVNPLGSIGGTLAASLTIISEALEGCPINVTQGCATQHNAMDAITNPVTAVICTDPPYYANIGYADLSDFFYVLLRKSMYRVYPELFSTMLVPKAEELVAEPFRHGNKERARQYFEQGLSQAFEHMHSKQNSLYPLALFYAFKQEEAGDNGKDQISGSTVNVSTGWETLLNAMLNAGFLIAGTWPVHTERGSRARSLESNALASSIVLVCRPRSANAAPTSRRDFLNSLKRELPKALKDLQRGNIAPVDLAQAAIGPGMAVFSRYSKVLESDGTPMRVRTALQLINQTLDEVLAEQEGEYDTDTRWALAWFEQFGMEEGPYGVAETLSKAKNTSVGALVEAGILRAQAGKVRLLRRDELSSDWNPTRARRLTVWEVTQRLIQALQEHGDVGAAAILDHVGAYGEVARDLAYRLYTICERKKWADEALAYNSLVVEWSDISGEVERRGKKTAEQAPLL